MLVCSCFRYGEPVFSDGLHGMSSCVGTGSGHRYAGLLTVRAAWCLRDVPRSSSSSWGGSRPSGRIVGEVRGVVPRAWPYRSCQLPEGYRTETAAQTFPRRGSGIALGEDLLHDGAGHFQQLVDQERQQHQCRERIRQVLGSVSEVVFQVLDWTFFSVLNVSFSIFQWLRAARASSLALCGSSGRSVTQVNARRASSPEPRRSELCSIWIFKVRVRSMQFHLRYHAQPAIPLLLPFGRGIRKPRRIGTIQLSLQMRMVGRPSRQQKAQSMLLKQPDLGTLREQPIGDHDQVRAPIERSQDRNQSGPSTPLAVVLRRAIPVANRFYRHRQHPPPIRMHHHRTQQLLMGVRGRTVAMPGPQTARTVDPLGGKGAGAIHGY